MIAKQLSGKSIAAVTRSSRSMGTLTATMEFSHKEPVNKPFIAAAVRKAGATEGVKITANEKDAANVNLKFAVLGGSSAETVGQKGAAHFLSVAAFAGNKHESGIKVVRFLESHGVHFSATADREKIVYDVSVMADHVEPVVESLFNSLASGPHSPYVLDEIREQVALAYAKYANDTNAQLDDLIHETAFGEVSPLGSAFFASNVDKICVDSVLAYRAKQFVRNNLVIAGSGITFDSLKTLTDKYGKVVAAGEARAHPASTYTGGDNKVRVDLDGQTNLALAFHVPTGIAGQPYQVLNQLLANQLKNAGVVGRAFHVSHISNGLLGVHTTGDVAVASKNLQTAVEQLKAIAAGGVDVTGAKTQVAVHNFNCLEGKATGSLLKAALVGEDVAKLADTRGVTQQAVSEAAAKLLKSVPTYTVLGATAGTPTYSAVQKLLA